MKKQVINLKKLAGKNNRLVINNYFGSAEPSENSHQKVETPPITIYVETKPNYTIKNGNNHNSSKSENEAMCYK